MKQKRRSRLSKVSHKVANALTDLTKPILKRNFAYWLTKHRYRSTLAHASPALQIPTTHTFGAWRMDGPRVAGKPCHEILFEHQALKSDALRFRGKKLGPREKHRRKMDAARAAGLHHFVFAYHGAHDTYYARSDSVHVPAFGVFIRKELERFPRCHATRRDLKSPEAKRPTDREFFLPANGREWAGLQVKHDPRHKGNFWHYWGAERFLSVKGYGENLWTWKVEFHFLKQVAVHEFDALLWPYELRPRAGGKKLRAIIEPEAYDEVRRRHPSCLVVPYEWSGASPTRCLIRASESTARFVLETGKYPDMAGDADVL